MRGLLSWKAEHVVLAGPFHRQVGEACNPHAVRESTLKGGANEVRCEERQGDRHIDLRTLQFFRLFLRCQIYTGRAPPQSVAELEPARTPIKTIV
jgi:hypothetical protein